ncbi:hypothetical protein [Succinatimonas hippei]|uniref:hypothetical protein n=1 Tax=Succinatimonas hippei TaxID=626938 RepID=UPI002493B9AC|nr:hypothetical protein [Succinatimonas hippei]
MILAAESFFFYSGACLFVLGIITCFIPRHMRLGIVSMLIGDALFAAGIAFLVKSTDILISLGLETDLFIQHNSIFAVVFSIILYVVMFAVFVKFLKRKKKVKAEQEAAAYESQESSSKQEPTADAALFANVGKENKE